MKTLKKTLSVIFLPVTIIIVILSLLLIILGENLTFGEPKLLRKFFRIFPINNLLE